MWKKLTAGLLVLSMAGCISMPSLSAGVGLSTPVETDEEIDTDNMSINADVFALLDVAMLQAEVSLAMQTYEVLDGVTSEPSDIVNMPLAAIIKWKLSLAHIGVGLVWNIMDTSEVAGVDTDDYESYRIVAGVRLPEIMQFRLAAELMYDITDAELEGLAGGGESADLGVTQLRVSLGYNF